MISDIATIMWKEWREFFLQRGSARATALNLLLMAVVFGVFLPLQSGRAWVESPISLLAWVWLPLFLVTSLIADSFAGERERHTLETLLASRLSDRAILFGKVGAAIGYALAMTVALLGVALVTVNASTWTGKALLYPLTTVIGALVIGVFGTGLVAGLGVLLSLRAATVRQAAQSLSIGILLLVWMPIIGAQVLSPQAKQRLALFLVSLDPFLVGVAAVCVLVVLDIIVLALALARFQRCRLILD